MVRDLEVELRDEIDAMYKQARAKLAAGEHEGAVALALGAFAKLPEPKHDFDVSQSFVHTLAKILRDAGRFPEALRVMEELFASGTVEPFEDQPRFVFGTIYAAMGDEAAAKKWFGEANRISKGRCFRGEDPKYRRYVE